MRTWAIIFFGHYIFVEVAFAGYQIGFNQYGKPFQNNGNRQSQFDNNPYLNPIFNRPNNGNLNRPGNGNFNRPGNGNFQPSTNGNFNQPSGGSFNPSNNGNFNRPGNGNFQPSTNGNLNQPSGGSFNRPGNGNFQPSTNGNLNQPSGGSFNRPGNGNFQPSTNGNLNQPSGGSFNPSNNGNFNRPGNGILNRPGSGTFYPPSNNGNRPGNSNLNPGNGNFNRPGNNNFNPGNGNFNRPGNNNFNPGNGNVNRPGNNNFNPGNNDYNRPGQNPPSNTDAGNRPTAANENISGPQTQQAKEIVNAQIEKIRNRINAALPNNNNDISYTINSYLQSQSMKFVEATLDRRTGYKLQLLNTTNGRRATILATNFNPPSSPLHYFDETEELILENFNFRLNRRYNSQNNSLEPACVELSTRCVALGSKVIAPGGPTPQILSLGQYRPVKIVTTNDRGRTIETMTSNYISRVIESQRNQGRGSIIYNESEDLMLRDRIFHTDKKYDPKSKTIEITTYNYLANQARPSRVRATLYRVNKCTFNLVGTRN
ncbi:uncharacterized protein DDB_G0287625-like [Trichogramma pretiosum]|uniref:uncharacterized protein DDB_G0287625-like n=1 Tax=Trichogramma pretiosum TaxID=7493 RepID=UPI000C71B781|nr:uncharacterized protein DDB_G0287625-like [Trichogramma pretiosum]